MLSRSPHSFDTVSKKKKGQIRFLTQSPPPGPRYHNEKKKVKLGSVGFKNVLRPIIVSHAVLYAWPYSGRGRFPCSTPRNAFINFFLHSPHVPIYLYIKLFSKLNKLKKILYMCIIL